MRKICNRPRRNRVQVTDLVSRMRNVEPKPSRARARGRVALGGRRRWLVRGTGMCSVNSCKKLLENLLRFVLYTYQGVKSPVCGCVHVRYVVKLLNIFTPPPTGSTELNLTDLAKARSRSASSAKAALAMCPFARRANEWLRGAR